MRLPILVGLIASAGVCVVVFAAVGKPSEVTLGSYSTSMEGRMRSQRHNAELSLRQLDGKSIGPGEVFSYNQAVGSWTRDQGYRKAPVSYNGQLVSSWGGGVCQTSTTLYNAALLAGLEIVERHPHCFSPSYVPPGRDAAVAFSDVDLRLRNPYDVPVKLKSAISGDRLIVEVVGSKKLVRAPQIAVEVLQERQPREYVIRGVSHYGQVRNSGKAGYEVLVWRLVGEKRELVSRDDYPTMNRIVEYR